MEKRKKKGEVQLALAPKKGYVVCILFISEDSNDG